MQKGPAKQKTQLADLHRMPESQAQPERKSMFR